MKKIQTLMLVLLLIGFIFSISTSAIAEKGHMTLLTVGERGNETFGGTADVYLEIKSGSGRIFIDSFPLTKLDTQISTRFANEIACDFLDKDCSNIDFFYTIRAKSSVVGGPSAGGALTVLTIAVLENLDLDESVVMTGTINSGGIIGPVAGIKEKVQAAKNQGFTKALVPKRSIISTIEPEFLLDEDDDSGFNITRNATIVYSDSLEVEGIDTITISTIEDALFHFTGKKYPDYSYEMEIPQGYLQMMKSVSENICKRADEIKSMISDEVLENNTEKRNLTENFIEKARDATEKQDYYTAASYCFNANKFYREIEYGQYSQDSRELILRDAQIQLDRMMDAINKRQLKTISELEASMVVKERLFEAGNLIERNNSVEAEELAYIVERIYSAEAWSAFFEYPGKAVVLDDNHLSRACLGKIAEAEERINYFELLFGEYADYRDELEDAKLIYNSEDYAYCLFMASRIKAEVNTILTSMSITQEKFPELLDDQLKLARTQINKQGNDFPIIGYSYYNYAQSLRETRPELALIYSEYASEFSSLDMYFPKEKNRIILIDRQHIGVFLLGFSAGLFILISGMTIYDRYRKRKLKKIHQHHTDERSLSKSGVKRKSSVQSYNTKIPQFRKR
jgi:uncharacterized protein